MTQNNLKAAEEFVLKVREALADLPGGVVAQLTDGLVDDIVERIREEGSARTLGSAAAFAAELRESAGVVVTPTERYRSKLWRAIKPALTSFFKSLRPIWWVLRVFIFYGMVRMVPFTIFHMPFGQEFHPIPDPDLAVEWWIIAALCLFSIQWGRGKWGIRFFRWLVTPVNALLVLLAIPFFTLTGVAIEQANHDRMMLEGHWIIVDGFVVPQPQIFDKDGNELNWSEIRDSSGTIVFRNK